MVYVNTAVYTVKVNSSIITGDIEIIACLQWESYFTSSAEKGTLAMAYFE